MRDTLAFGRHLNPTWDDDLAIERMRRHDIDLRQRAAFAKEIVGSAF